MKFVKTDFDGLIIIKHDLIREIEDFSKKRLNLNH